MIDQYNLCPMQYDVRHGYPHSLFLSAKDVEDRERLQTTVDVHRNSKVVLNDAIAVEIYSAKHGKSRHDAQRLAMRYGVTAKTIRDIWRRRTWTRSTRHLWCRDDLREIKRGLASRSCRPTLHNPPPPQGPQQLPDQFQSISTLTVLQNSGSTEGSRALWSLQHEHHSDILQGNCAETASQQVFTDVYFDEHGWLMDPRVIRFFISN